MPVSYNQMDFNCDTEILCGEIDKNVINYSEENDDRFVLKDYKNLA